MVFLNRYRLKKYRRLAIRRWRTPAESGRKHRKAAFHLFLLSALTAELALLGQGTGGILRIVKDMVHVTYIDDREPDKQGSAAVKDGIQILLDEGSVSIFHVEEHGEQAE